MTIPLKNPSKELRDFLLQKQLDYKKEKGRIVSLSYTIERLLKEVYLKQGRLDYETIGKQIGDKTSGQLDFGDCNIKKEDKK